MQAALSLAEPGTWIALTAVAASIALAMHVLRLRRRIHRQRQDLKQTLREEKRMFEFLHGLGERMQVGGSMREMHRLIVGGVIKVVDARGGILYLFDPLTKELVPAFVSPSCPALLPFPEEIRLANQRNPKAMRGYQQLRSLSMSTPLTRRLFDSQKPLYDPEFVGLEETPADMHAPPRAPAMLAPLFRGQAPLGLLVVTRHPDDPGFSANDFHVFESVAEQSGFAMISSLSHREAVEKQTLESELRTASEIQRILLPEDEPSIPGYRVVGVNRAARYVSGDFFDYIHISPDRSGIVIADVSGKGVAASLITAMCRSILRTTAPGEPAPARVLARVNEMLYPDMREDMFISLAYLVLDHTGNRITMARAGHDAPIVCRAATGEIERITCPGLALGVDHGPVFRRVTRDFEFSLEPGDCLILYTDGVSEALDIHGDEFGMERVHQTLREKAPQGAAAVVEALIERVGKFVGGHPQSDDITLIAIQRL